MYKVIHVERNKELWQDMTINKIEMLLIPCKSKWYIFQKMKTHQML